MTDVEANTRPRARRQRRGWWTTLGTVLTLDLRSIVRQPVVLASALLMPVVVAVVVTSALSAVPDLRTTWVLVDNDPVAANALEKAITGNADLRKVVTIERRTRAEAERLVDGGDASAALVLPAGLLASFSSPNPLDVEVIAADDADFGAALARLVAREFVIRSWATVAAATSGPWPLEVVVQSADGRAIDTAGHYGPAVATFFVLLSLGFAAQARMKERETGVEDRIKSTAAPSLAVIVAHALAGVAIGTASMTVTLATMSLIYGRSWGSLPALAVLIFAVVIAFSGIAALIASVVRTTNQAMLITATTSFVFALASGSLAPPGSAALPSFAWMAPTTHILDAFAELGVGGAGISGIVPQLAVLAGIGAVTTGLAHALTTRR